MKIDDLTIGEAKSLSGLFNYAANDKHWKIGKIYLIRTVTMIQVGRLIAATDKELVLEDAAWIADTGRFSEALTSGTLSEVEPFPDGEVIVGRGAIIDACLFSTIQRSQK